MNSNTLFDNNHNSTELPKEGIFSEVKLKGEEIPKILNLPIQRLIKKYQESYQPPRKGELLTIHVDEIASKIANFYEKIRKIIDWKEENLLRRSAVERILKRSMIAEISNLQFIFKVNIEAVAEPLVLELIRGGHLPNDEIPEEKISEVDKIVKKYFYLLRNAPLDSFGPTFPLKLKVNFYDWIMEVAACEIEEVLAPPTRENALIESMTVLMNERIKLNTAEKMTVEEKLVQTYIAVHRTLFDLDDAIITYHLLKYENPFWTNPSEEFLKEAAKNIFKIKEEIDRELKQPLNKKFFNICERTDTVFTLLDDVLSSFKSEPEKIPQIFGNRENLSSLVTQFYQKRFKTLKRRLFKLAVFSTLSVFVSNWFTFFIVEVPLASLFYEGFNFLAATVDFLMPTLFMFFLVSIIKPPPPSNQNKVIELFFRFVYEGESKDIYEIKPKKKKRILTNLIIASFYIIAACLFFGTMAYIFYIGQIPVTSIIFNTLAIAINIFAALVIRNKSREITVEEKTGFWEFLLDIFSVPSAEFGSFFANKWREYNVISVFFNVVIEMPFVTVIEFVEDWRNFLKEKKADIH